MKKLVLRVLQVLAQTTKPSGEDDRKSSGTDARMIPSSEPKELIVQPRVDVDGETYVIIRNYPMRRSPTSKNPVK